MASATPQQPEARETAADEEDEAESQVPQVASILLTVAVSSSAFTINVGRVS